MHEGAFFDTYYVRTARDGLFLTKMLTSSAILDEVTALGPPPRKLPPAESYMLDLDIQHDRVRQSYAVMRGEENVE